MRLVITGPVAVSLADAALELIRPRGESYEYVGETMAEVLVSSVPCGVAEAAVGPL